MDAIDASLLEQADSFIASAHSMESKIFCGETLAKPTHLRSSSTASSSSSPLAFGLSTRTHSRWPSSASSSATSPDSPALVAKTALHDLLEESSELSDEDSPTSEVDALDEFCLCDSIFCEHQRILSFPGTPLDRSPASIDQCLSLDDCALGASSERRESDSSLHGRNSTQFSSRLSSLSRLCRRRRTASSITSTSASISGARSAPPSRSPSFSNLNWKFSLFANLQSPRLDHVPDLASGNSISETECEADILDDPFFLDLAEESMEGPRAPTPLLPFISSPLQADEYAEAEAAETTLPSDPPPTNTTLESSINSPLSAAASPTLLRSPALSTKPSSASLRTGSCLHGAEIPLPNGPEQEFDLWALKLGHANFHITPESYLPLDPATTETCLRLRQDWESARLAFMRQAALIAEHYGLTSRTYALTCEKWEEVDALWRSNYERTLSSADAPDTSSPSQAIQSPNFRPLPSTQAVLPMPSLSGDKFPAVEEEDIIGPMVRYESIEAELQGSEGGSSNASASASGRGRGRSILRLITDKAALLRKS